MKKVKLIIIIGIFLVGSAIAGGTFVFNNRTVDVEHESNQRLEAKGIYNWTTTVKEMDNGLIEMCMKIKEPIHNKIILNKCESTQKGERTEEDIKFLTLKWESEILDKVISRYEDKDIPVEVINVIKENVSIEEIQGEYPIWSENKYYKKGDIVLYQGEQYEVTQEHASQEDWKPIDVASLYKINNDENIIKKWVQPQGAHDCYKLNDKVIFNEEIWVNVGSDCNTYSPSVWGWELDE